MCVYLRQNEIECLIAERDIVCYKVLKKDGDKLYAPYRGNMYYQYRLTHSFLSNPKEKNKIFTDMVLSYTEKGLYTYSTLYCTSFNEFDFLKQNGYYIFECVIPKGSRYYMHTHWKDNGEIYISDTLIVKQQLTFY